MDGLERNESTGASFAYRAEGGAPWHLLGVPMAGHQTAEAILTAASANYHVSVEQTYVLDKMGRPVAVDGQYATVRTNPHTNQLQPLGAVKSRYTVLQNIDTVERILAILGAARGHATLDTAGVLFDGRQFFATIDLGTMIIDPAGVNDSIGRYLVVRTSHDGTTPLTYACTDIRAVCHNTVVAGLATASRVFKAKHTPNVDDRLEEAMEVLSLSNTWASEFQKMAQEMLAIPMTPARFDRVINSVVEEASTQRKKVNRDQTVEAMKAIYVSDKNSGLVGDNGWAAWNAIVEYYDHYRPARDARERALTSMDDASWVTRRKIVAQNAVLALA